MTTPDNNPHLESNLDRFIAEEQFFLDLYYKELRFFWASIGVVFAGTIAGALRVNSSFDYITLIVGPVLVWFVADSLSASLRRSYRRFLECVASRAKIELRLGMCEPSSHDLAYWGNEAIVSTRHLDSRINTESSSDFVESNCNGGVNAVHFSLVRSVQYLAIGFAFLLIIGAFLHEESNSSTPEVTHKHELQKLK